MLKSNRGINYIFFSLYGGIWKGRKNKKRGQNVVLLPSNQSSSTFQLG